MSQPPRKQTSKQSSTGQQSQGPAVQQHMSPGDEAPPGTPGTGENLCRACEGTGLQKGQPCPQCEGTGYVITGIGGA